MIRFILLFIAILIPSTITADTLKSDRYSDCIILKDEDSIVCKYIHERVNTETIVKVQWIEPNGEITRAREITIPAGHASIYDFRYIKGRVVGVWGFKVTENNQESITNFTIE